MSEKAWAKVGRIETVVAIVAAVVALFFLFKDRWSGPRIEGTYDIESVVLPPGVRDQLNDHVSWWWVSNVVCLSNAITSPSNLLAELETDHTANFLRTKLYSHAYCVCIIRLENRGRLTAKDVRLSMPTSGTADCSEYPNLFSSSRLERGNETNQFFIGDLEPKKPLEVLFWSGPMNLAYSSRQPSITYDGGYVELEAVGEFNARYVSLLEYLQEKWWLAGMTILSAAFTVHSMVKARLIIFNFRQFPRRARNQNTTAGS